MSFVRSADFTRFAQCRTLITHSACGTLHISRVAGDADSVAQYVNVNEPLNYAGLFERDMTCATFPGMRCELDLFGGVQRRIPGNVALREPRIVANAGNTQSCGPLRLDAGRLD